MPTSPAMTRHSCASGHVCTYNAVGPISSVFVSFEVGLGVEPKPLMWKLAPPKMCRSNTPSL